MNDVTVYSGSQSVGVNGDFLTFDFNTPSVFPENFYYLLWWKGNNKYSYFTIEDGDVNKQTEHALEPTEENYQKYVQPFVDQWNTEKERLEAIENSLENRQKIALEFLNTKFEEAKIESHVKSSLGFTIDADSTANENINGLLITTKDDETVYFCDYDNVVHPVTKMDLETMREEIIKNAQNLYNQKWSYRSAIEKATDSETVDGIAETITFVFLDFTV